MNSTPYEPEGATVLWDCVVGDRVDRILAVDTHHKVTIRRLTMVQHHLLVSQADELHPHSFWHEMPRDRAAQLVEGKRFGLVGHTLFDIPPAKNIHQIWPAVHSYSLHGCGFRSVPTMVQAHELVESDRMVLVVQKAYNAAMERRMTHADVVNGVPE